MDKSNAAGIDEIKDRAARAQSKGDELLGEAARWLCAATKLRRLAKRMKREARQEATGGDDEI